MHIDPSLQVLSSVLRIVSFRCHRHETSLVPIGQIRKLRFRSKSPHSQTRCADVLGFENRSFWFRVCGGDMRFGVGLFTFNPDSAVQPLCNFEQGPPSPLRTSVFSPVKKKKTTGDDNSTYLIGPFQRFNELFHGGNIELRLADSMSLVHNGRFDYSMPRDLLHKNARTSYP